jgi:hypothetical protein
MMIMPGHACSDCAAAGVTNATGTIMSAVHSTPNTGHTHNICSYRHSKLRPQVKNTPPYLPTWHCPQPLAGEQPRSTSYSDAVFSTSSAQHSPAQHPQRGHSLKHVTPHCHWLQCCLLLTTSQQRNSTSSNSNTFTHTHTHTHTRSNRSPPEALPAQSK